MYAYDSLGRRHTEGPSGNPSQTTYTWSGDSLTQYSGPGGTATYTYDGDGQRVRSVVTTAGITTTTTYDYSGTRLNALDATRSDGTTYSIDYLYGDDGAVFAGAYRGSDATAGVPFMLVTTDRGDVRELLDASGASFAFYAYDAYGNPDTARSASATTSLVPTASVAAAIAARQPLRYESYAFDAESGLYYCSARYYDPATFAFISRDPIKADAEESLYQYCGGDPVQNTDPSGHEMTGYMISMELAAGMDLDTAYAYHTQGHKYVGNSYHKKRVTLQAKYRKKYKHGNPYQGFETSSKAGKAWAQRRKEENARAQKKFHQQCVDACMRDLATGAHEPTEWYDPAEVAINVTAGAVVGSLANVARSAIAGTASEAIGTLGGEADAAQYARLKLDLAREELTGGDGINLGHAHIADSLAGRYGGEAADWFKMTSTDRVLDGRPVQFHYFENVATGMRVGMKPVYGRFLP